jgi:murein L,D-transpeptidase YafK
LKKSTLRALLAPAVTAAAIALAGCNSDSIAPTGRAQAPLSPQMLSLVSEKGMDKGSPILVRLFKEESELEVWKKNRDGQFALLKTYPICKWSGELGPKKKEGDRQAPEGFYTITPAQMNPKSSYYLSFNTGYPNAYDRAWGRTGSELMVHGDCSSRGCYAMTDEQIQEIYALARESFFGGQREFQLQAFPFRMTALNMAKHRNNPNFAFWKMLKEGYDHFNATHQEPKVAVCEKRYVFDPAPPEGVSEPLSFSPRGQCPVHRLDPTIANAVLDYRRREQVKMANYIANGVRTVPIHTGVDGGMNPVFAQKFAHNEFDNSGRIYQTASAVPGAMSRTTTPTTPAAQESPATVTRTAKTVPVPAPAPKKDGETPARSGTIASLLGNLFGSGSSEAPSNEAKGTAVEPRGATAASSAKSKRAPARTTVAAKPVPQPKEAEPEPEPKAAVARDTPEPKPAVVEQAKDTDEAATQLRTAFSAPPPARGGLLAGAQPVVPAGSFDARWSAWR